MSFPLLQLHYEFLYLALSNYLRLRSCYHGHWINTGHDSTNEMIFRRLSLTSPAPLPHPLRWHDVILSCHVTCDQSMVHHVTAATQCKRFRNKIGQASDNEGNMQPVASGPGERLRQSRGDQIGRYKEELEQELTPRISEFEILEEKKTTTTTRDERRPSAADEAPEDGAEDHSKRVRQEDRHKDGNKAPCYLSFCLSLSSPSMSLSLMPSE